MCGFVGFRTHYDASTSQDIIHRMADRIIHRGPDSDGYFVDDRFALGFRRLSIIDLDSGDQPMINESGTRILCFNGEIYNHRELRKELENLGFIFKTNCDSEALLHGYEAWGPDLLPRLRGMFAFIVYETDTGRLFGARDIFGIKPFYYYIEEAERAVDGEAEHESVFMFGSEIKGFLPHPEFKKSLKRELLPQYLCFEYIPNNETLFENVYKLQAGHYFYYTDENGLEITRYHQFIYDIDEGKSLDDWATEIADELHDSVDLHLNADVEVGCFLSAGVDSSLVTKEASTCLPVRSFSVGYAEQKYSELDVAKEFSQVINVENISRTISSQDFFDSVGAVQYHMDEPLPNPSAVPLYFVASEASKNLKVVLSGEGADELFGGYTYYQECLDFTKYKRVPLPIRKALANISGKLPKFHGQRFLTRGQYPLSKRYIRNTYVYNLDEARDLLVGDVSETPPECYSASVFGEVDGLDEVTQMQYADINLWLQYDILQKADKMSMAHSLELRVPYLDKEVLDVALQIPSEHRVSKRDTKLALREAAKKSVPEKTAIMPKIGFITPLNQWLKEDANYKRVKTAFESDEAAQFFKQDKILKLLEDHKTGRAGNMKKIWTIYCFLVWYEEFFVKR